MEVRIFNVLPEMSKKHFIPFCALQQHFFDKYYHLVQPCLDLARIQAARVPALHWKFELEMQGELLPVLVQLAAVQIRLKTVMLFLIMREILKSLELEPVTALAAPWPGICQQRKVP